ncbi:hypothetical protein E2C01_100969 [Portunus trituberculatus]|uniref:Uncharacterized protein n=1 Tax=Portunus trituberculatus TaxID=210409 RepID=A0A5B7KIW0_PORTR|nr:hypothetical protein [Portunus trituberculatus]
MWRRGCEPSMAATVFPPPPRGDPGDAATLGECDGWGGDDGGLKRAISGSAMRQHLLACRWAGEAGGPGGGAKLIVRTW